MAHGKRYRELYSRVDREHQYTPAEAVRLVKQMQSAKFTETVECHIRTRLNVRHAEEQLRGTITLPHMAGTDVTVIVFARGDRARDAEAAGAYAVGDDDLAKRIQDGWTDFDVATALSQAKAGRMEYRTDRSAIVHMSIGKTDLSERELLENYAALIDEIVRAKPAAAKGRYLRTITLATTYGPGVRVDPTRTRDIVEELAEDGDATAADA